LPYQSNVRGHWVGSIFLLAPDFFPRYIHFSLLNQTEREFTLLKKIMLVMTAVVSIALMSGCANLADARAAKGSGMVKEYAATRDDVWGALPPILTELKLPLAGENKAEGYMLAQRGVSALSYGENVAIFVDTSTGGSKTKVEVVSKKALATNFLAPDWAKEIHDKLGEKFK
jgi:uncharacterized protein YceK